MSVAIVSNNTEDSCLRQLQLHIKANQELDNFSEFLGDRFLLHFVRAKKYDSEKACASFDNFMNIRRIKYKEMFKSLRPSTNLGLQLGIVRAGLLRVLANRDHLNRLVVIHRLDCWDPQQLSMQELTNTIMLCLEEALNFKEAEVNGIVLVFDMAGFKAYHTTTATVSEMVKAISLFWKNFPLRPQAIHVLNEIFLLTIFFNTVKRLLPKKIKERINFHGSNFETLYEFVSPKILPKRFGGQLLEVDAFDLEFEQRIIDKEGSYARFSEILKSTV